MSSNPVNYWYGHCGYKLIIQIGRLSGGGFVFILINNA